jgi:hypothetical protein
VETPLRSNQPPMRPDATQPNSWAEMARQAKRIGHQTAAAYASHDSPPRGYQVAHVAWGLQACRVPVSGFDHAVRGSLHVHAPPLTPATGCRLGRWVQITDEESDGGDCDGRGGWPRRHHHGSKAPRKRALPAAAAASVAKRKVQRRSRACRSGAGS